MQENERTESAGEWRAGELRERENRKSGERRERENGEWGDRESRRMRMGRAGEWGVWERVRGGGEQGVGERVQEKSGGEHEELLDNIQHEEGIVQDHAWA